MRTAALTCLYRNDSLKSSPGPKAITRGPGDPCGGRWGNILHAVGDQPRMVRSSAARSPLCHVKGKSRGPPAAGADAPRPDKGPSDAETGVRMVRLTTKPARVSETNRRVVGEPKGPIPVTASEIDLLLHWAGDLLADLMKDDSVGG
jgi:hypothetical protein